MDRDIDMGYGLSIWDMEYRYGYLPFRYGHPGYQYGIWSHDMGDDSIDMVILHIDMGYPVTLVLTRSRCEWLSQSACCGHPCLDGTHVVAAQVEFESRS
jgi:hypothetical protein